MPPAPLDLPDAARRVVETLQRHVHDAVWAGGCVRDRLMGRPPKDYDVATSARPDEIEKLFPRTRSVGRSFGVILVLEDQLAIEVATFRRDLGYADGRRPTAVEFTTDREDAARRDFTINGLFYDPIRDQVRDYIGGRDDIERRTVRAIGRPESRFQEDYLRMIRAVRFAATLNFTIHPDTFAALQQNAAHITAIAPERIQQELTRILTEAPRAGDALRLLDDAGLLREILPEIHAMKGVEQSPEYHPEGDVFEHTILILNQMPPSPPPALAYAAMLHDVGKPVTQKVLNDTDGKARITFYEHDRIGAEIAGSILRRLRFSNDFVETVSTCIRNHMRFMDVPEMREATLRKMVGAPAFPLELELHRLDCVASHGKLDHYHFLLDFSARLQSRPALPSPFLDGHDLMAMGIPSGPQIGKLLKQVYDAQLEGRFTDRSAALEWARQQAAHPRADPD